jgi:hypothetical protein
MSRRGEPLIKPPIIKPTSDLFIASLWSAPEREPLLRSAVNTFILALMFSMMILRRDNSLLNTFSVADNGCFLLFVIGIKLQA